MSNRAPISPQFVDRSLARPGHLVTWSPGHLVTRRKATALVSVIAILLIVAAFAGVFLSTHAAQISTETAGIHRLRAQAAAMAATHLTVWDLNNDDDLRGAMGRVVCEDDTSFDADPLFSVTGDLAGATFSVDVWPGPDTARLKTTGISGGVYYERWTHTPTMLARPSLSASDNVEIKGSGYIDSFDSTLGPYGGANVSSSAVISTNNTDASAIKLDVNADGNPVFYGDILVGPDGDPNSVLDIEPGATITGGIGALCQPVPIPTLTEPTDTGASLGDLHVSSGTTVWSANRHYNKVTFDGTAILEISGDIVVLADDDFVFDDDAQLRILPDSSLTLYTKDKVKFVGNSRGNVNTADPSKFKILMLEGGHLDTKGSAELYAIGVNPAAELHLTDTSHFYGVFAGKKIKVEKFSGLHQDLSLGGPGILWP